MSRRSSTSKEEMIEAAFQLVRKDGLDALTARNLAARIGCSTQPIMYRFPNLAELRDLVCKRADEYHTAYLLADNNLLGIGLRYIEFAGKETNLFRLLFQSGHFDGVNLTDMLEAPEVAQMVEATSRELSLPKDAALSAFEALYVAVHGYASLIANNAITYDPIAIEKTLTVIAEGLLGETSESR